MPPAARPENSYAAPQRFEYATAPSYSIVIVSPAASAVVTYALATRAPRLLPTLLCLFWSTA